MPKSFTVISGSLCSSVKVGNRLRGGRPRDRCSIPGSSSLFYSNPQPPDLIQGRPNIIFNGHQGIFLWGRGYKVPHPLLWATSRVARGKIAVSVIANSLSYCAIVIAYTELTNWLTVAQ